MKQVWPLPPKAQEELRQAASVSIDKDPDARVKAIDRTTDKLRVLFPEHFRDEEDTNGNPPGSSE